MISAAPSLPPPFPPYSPPLSSSPSIGGREGDQRERESNQKFFKRPLKLRHTDFLCVILASSDH